MSSMSSKKNADQVDISMVIDDIWDRISAKEIDMSYALEGFQMSESGCEDDFRSIYNCDLVVDLLINYGYEMRYILAFLDDAYSKFAEDCSCPVMMIPLRKQSIYDDIAKIQDVDDMMMRLSKKRGRK